MKKLLCFTIGFTIALSSPVSASNWWDKAMDMINAPAASENSPSSSSKSGNALANADIEAGLREALVVGTGKVVGQLGAEDGFNKDPKVHIPLPDTLARVDAALGAIGMSSLTDNLELKLNRAAEAATPKAKELFIDAISQMTIADAKNILTGPDDAATSYLRRTMGPGLSEEMAPIVDKALSSAGAIQAYDSMIGEYSKLPFVPDAKANLKTYVVEKAMDGIFLYVAEEEAAIRNNPAKRTTDLLKKVFSGI